MWLGLGIGALLIGALLGGLAARRKGERL